MYKKIIAVVAIIAINLFCATGHATKFMNFEKGSQGEEVKKIQEKLIELGYLNDTPDGIFGIMTEKAVEDFQENNDLFIDGIVDLETYEKLFQISLSATDENEQNNTIEDNQEEHNAPFTVTYYKTFIRDKEYIKITFTGYNEGTVKMYYKKKNNDPDYGTFTGNLDIGMNVTFALFKDPVVFKYTNPGDHNKIDWITSKGSVMMTYGILS